MTGVPDDERAASMKESKALVPAGHQTEEEAFAFNTAAPAGEGPSRKDRLLRQIAKLDLLADCMFKASYETFARADIDADSPHQAAAMKREAASMGKSCATLFLNSERLREIAEKADR